MRGKGKGRGVNGSKFGVSMRLFGSPMNPFRTCSKCAALGNLRLNQPPCRLIQVADQLL